MFKAVAKMLLRELNQLALFYNADIFRTSPPLLISGLRELDPEHRIRRALDVVHQPIPHVDEASLTAYYRYLSANVLFPFAAHYPWPTNPREKIENCCLVLELLDPRKDLGDALNGLYCKTRKGDYEMNLPLLDLHLPESSPAFDLIEDYWYWFWNWQ